MDIVHRIRETGGLTPTEQHLARTVLNLGERVQGYTIKELAQATSSSISSIHRLCRKLGLTGFKELKVELARSPMLAHGVPEEIDANFPFRAGEHAREIAPRIERLYASTLAETRQVLSPEEVDRVASLIRESVQVDIYTQSHNLYPANMFCDRLLSAGKPATCHEHIERQVRCALASDQSHLAIVISYSGLAPNLGNLLPILSERACPVVLIGTPRAARAHSGLAAYLLVSDRESLQHRITQYASHISVQYVLDTLFSCYFAQTYEESEAFLESSLPYTRLPGAAEGAGGTGRRAATDAIPVDETALGLVQTLR